MRNFFTNIFKGDSLLKFPTHRPPTFFLVAVATIVFATFLMSYPQPKPLSAQGGTPFGGQSTYVFYCTCSGNIAVTINDLTISPPVSAPLIYQPGTTILYDFKQIYTTGVWTLGLWQPGGTCTYYVGKGCSTYTTAGTMIMVGTSLGGGGAGAGGGGAGGAGGGGAGLPTPPAIPACSSPPAGPTCLCPGGVYPNKNPSTGAWYCP